MLREYEFTVITKADLPEATQTELFNRYEQYLKKDGGEIIQKEVWGVKRMTFPIKKEHRGNYVIYDCLSDPANITEIERLMRIDDNVLRYLTVHIGDNVDVAERRAELAKLKSKSFEGPSSHDDDDWSGEPGSEGDSEGR